MDDVGRLFLIAGVSFIVIGFAFLYGPKIPFLGKLPGDIFISNGNFSFYFPLVTSIILSIIITIIINLFR